MELSTVHNKDNDQISVKGVYLNESNEELENFRNNNKQNYIATGASPLRSVSSDVCQAAYALTRVLPNMTSITKKVMFGWGVYYE